MIAHAADFTEAVRRVAASGVVLLGPETESLEHEFATFCGANEAVAVASGASAIQLALVALGIGPGDEVVVPAMTAVPTASAVCAVGARPVFADVDGATAAITVESARSVITSRTKAIIAVHLYGRPVDDVAGLVGLGLPVLEDCAQSHGATPRVNGTLACYSFYPTKNLGGVGAQSAQYVHVDVSQNHRMSEIECAWLRICLPELAGGNVRRRSIVERYRAAAPALRWHADHRHHVFHLATLRHHDRDGFRARLAEAGVGTGVHYPLALTQQPGYQSFVGGPCPSAEAWAVETVSLPCFPELTDDEVERVCAALAAVS
jgi:dTDP-3-amino-2,3,6-trideoxy-4-keto-D-glucose/dTDP-3-amino-3,4,6-trideoxy-alpha-D-glucose/dTDP-2,6-dideoxy-D-kanosamine transaminase